MKLCHSRHSFAVYIRTVFAVIGQNVSAVITDYHTVMGACKIIIYNNVVIRSSSYGYLLSKLIF